MAGGRRAGRMRYTDEMIAGLQCVVCEVDYRRQPATSAVPVGTFNGGHLAACRGACARSLTGEPDGWETLHNEELLPLQERVDWFIED